MSPGEEIRDIRQALGLTQAEMGAQLGTAEEPIHFTTVNRWEHGHRAVNPSALKLARKLLGEKDEPGS